MFVMFSLINRMNLVRRKCFSGRNGCWTDWFIPTCRHHFLRNIFIYNFPLNGNLMEMFSVCSMDRCVLSLSGSEVKLKMLSWRLSWHYWRFRIIGKKILKTETDRRRHLCMNYFGFYTELRTKPSAWRWDLRLNSHSPCSSSPAHQVGSKCI